MRSEKRDGRALFVVHAQADLWFVRGVLVPAMGLPPDQVQLTGELPLGGSVLETLERGIAASRTTVVVMSAAFIADGWSQHTALLASHAAVEEGHGGGPVVIPVVIPLWLDDAAAPLRFRALVSLDLRDRARWDAELAKLLAFLGSATPASREPEEIPCPYSGLRALEREDEARLYGRTEELGRILGRLSTGERELFVMGPSGSGQSSLVSAGLVPRLERGASGIAGVVVRRLRPGGEPLARLLAALDGGEARQGSKAATGHAGEPRPSSAALAAELRARVDRLLAPHPAGHHLLLHIDQLEEVFALASAAERTRFFDALVTLRADARCLIIHCLRAEFLAALMESSLWMEGRSHREVIGPLRGEELYQAIVRPALGVGVHLEPALAERLCADAAGASIALPLIQETLVQLWALRRHKVLSLHGYEQLGDEGRSGLVMAMSRRADACLRELAPEREAVARRILLRLVSFGESSLDTRWQRPRAALGLAGEPPAECEQVLEHLLRSRLVTTEADPGRSSQPEPRVDLAHAALISAWDTLAGWIKARRADGQRRHQLEQAAASWVARGRGAGGLLENEELRAARAWQASEGGRELGQSSDVTALLAASERAVRRRWWRLKGVALGGAALLGLLLLLVVLLRGRGAQVAHGQAAISALLDTTQQQHAQRDQELARQYLLEGHPQRALPHLVAALQRLGSAEPDAALRLMLHQAGKELLQLEVSPLGQRIFRHEKVVLSAAFSADGERVITAGADKTARLWRVAGGEQLTIFQHEKGRVEQAALSPDGKLAVTAGSEGHARLWDAVTGEPRGPKLMHRAGVLSVAFSPDGKRLVTASSDRSAQLWDVATGRALFSSMQHPAPVTSVAFSPDGMRLATACADGQVRLWDATGEPLPIALPHVSFVESVQFSPDGEQLVTASRDRLARVWTLAAGKRSFLALEHLQGVESARFSPDGALIATASRDKHARIWDARTGVLVAIRRTADEVRAVAWSPDGAWLAVGGNDRMVQLWDVTRDARPAQVWREIAARGAFQLEGGRLVDASRLEPRLPELGVGREDEVMAIVPAPSKAAEPRRRPRAPIRAGALQQVRAAAPPSSAAPPPLSSPSPAASPEPRCALAWAVPPASGGGSGCTPPPTAEPAFSGRAVPLFFPSSQPR